MALRPPSEKKPRHGVSDGVAIGASETLPIVPLVGAVLFPNNSLPIALPESLQAKDLASARQGRLRLGIVPSLGGDSPESTKFAAIGVEAVVTSILRLPNGQTGAVVRGERRFIPKEPLLRRGGWVATVQFVGDRPLKRTAQFYATGRALKNAIGRILRMNLGVSEDMAAVLTASDDPAVLCDLVVPYLSLSLEERLALLGNFNLRDRMRQVLEALAREADLLKLSSRIHDQVKGDLHEMARRNYLREQIRAIKRELGEMDGFPSEVDELAARLAELTLAPSVRESVEREIDRLAMMAPGSPEYIVSHTYLTWMRDLPWDSSEPQAPRLRLAREVLNRDHFGLTKVKERILEYLAVMQHRGGAGSNGQILLLSGPPGVGKTSLVRSVAEALGRPFVRVSLGGVKDEAEIRGHRRTYVGSLPGKIIQAMKQAGSRYPVILLDEIDKTGQDGRSDLSAALLEVLDPEQNKSFVDHYLGVPFDLSGVVFIATANSTDTLSEPLLDRMDVVALSGYTDQEKLEIARNHLLPGVRLDLGLTVNQLRPSDRTLRMIMRYYTREAGVRQLKRELATIGRKVVKQLVESSQKKSTKITTQNLVHWLGNPRYLDEPNDATLVPGVAVGLAYTAFGGDILYVESSRTRLTQGGRLTLTGSLGKIMQESAYAVLAFLMANASSIGLDLQDLEESHVHLHLPDGGTPKDGPSAGIAIMCAMASLFTGKPLPADLAMTGEITLRGQVLAVGGIKEKLLAADRYGKTRVMLPAANWHDLADIPKDVLRRLELIPLVTMEDALIAAGLMAETTPRPVLEERARPANQRRHWTNQNGQPHAAP